MAIPYGHRGNEDAAFELIRWMTADDEGTTFMSRRMKLLPACRKSPFFEKDVRGDPIFEAYYAILQRAKHTRPVTPANAYYMKELRRALGWSLQDIYPPEKALKEAKKRTTKYFEKIQAKTKARHTL